MKGSPEKPWFGTSKSCLRAGFIVRRAESQRVHDILLYMVDAINRGTKLLPPKQSRHFDEAILWILNQEAGDEV